MRHLREKKKTHQALICGQKAGVRTKMFPQEMYEWYTLQVNKTA